MVSRRSQRKQERKAAVRARKRQARRWLWAAVVGGVLAAIGLAATIVLIEVTDSAPTAWSAGIGGVAGVACAVCLIVRERVALRSMTHMGRIGIGWVALLGLGLVTASVLFAVNADQPAELTTLLCLVPALLAILFLGVELLKGGPDTGGPSIGSQLSTIVSR